MVEYFLSTLGLSLADKLEHSLAVLSLPFYLLGEKPYLFFCQDYLAVDLLLLSRLVFHGGQGTTLWPC